MLGMYRNWLKKHPPQLLIQLISLAFFNGYITGFLNGKIFTGKTKGICVPVLNCYSCPGALGACPIGALQGVLNGKGSRFPFYVLGSIMLFGILLGRAICGLLCPFGLIQDLLYKIPLPKITIPKAVDKPLRFLKYPILIFMVLILPAFLKTSFGIGIPYFCKYMCPVGIIEGALPLMIKNHNLLQAIGDLFYIKLGILIFILLLSIAVARPFCKYICPLGAIYGLFNKYSLYQLTIDENKCVECKKCHRVCPMNVEVTKNINSPECIRCGKCVNVCPFNAIKSGFLKSDKK